MSLLHQPRDATHLGTSSRTSTAAVPRGSKDPCLTVAGAPATNGRDLGHWSKHAVSATVDLPTREVHMSSALERSPVLPDQPQLRVPTPVKRFGYVVAATVNGVMLWAAHQLLDWGWPSFLTDEFEQVLGLVAASLIAGIVVNLTLAIHHRGRVRALADLVTATFGLVVGLRMWQVFPVDFTGYATDWSGPVRVALGVGIGATGIAIIANLVKLVTGPQDHA